MLNNNERFFPDNKRNLLQESEEKTEKFPTVDEELLKRLEQMYPNVAPDPRASETEKIIHCAQAQLVAFLREQYKLQTETQEILCA